MRCAVGSGRVGPTGKKGGLETAITAEITAEAARLIGDGVLDGLDFEAVETRLRHVAMEVAAKALERHLNANHSDHDGPSRPCGCGHRARYAGQHPKTFSTALGTVTLERAYYHCSRCGRGVFPRDRALTMEDTSLSPGAMRMTGLVAAEVSFAVASEMMYVLAGLRVDPKQVERAAEALGTEIADDERRRLDAEVLSAPTLYLGMDGTGVPVRAKERQGQAGKQPDGTSKTREVKLVTVWTAETRDAKHRPLRDPGSTSYAAAIESAASRDPKTFTMALGKVTLERAYYHCDRCGSGFFPRDRALAMEDSALSPGAMRMTGFVAAEVSFTVASEMMYVLAGLRIDAKRVERTSEALGVEIAGDERCRIETESSSAPTLYLGMDGTGVPVRAEERQGTRRQAARRLVEDA